jgi:hypothetical protein
MTASIDSAGIHETGKAKFNPGWAKLLVLAGVAVAIACGLFNFGADYWNQRQLDQLIGACKAESAASHPCKGG